MSKIKFISSLPIFFLSFLTIIPSAKSETIKDYSATGPAKAAPTTEQRLTVVEKKTSYYQNKSAKKSVGFKKKKSSDGRATSLSLTCGKTTGSLDQSCTTNIKLDNKESGIIYLWYYGDFDLGRIDYAKSIFKIEINRTGGENVCNWSSLVTTRQIPRNFCSSAISKDETLNIKITFYQGQKVIDLEKYLNSANLNIAYQLIEISPPQ